MAKPLTFGSLFTGVGLIDLGFELAGWESRWMVEKDKWCQAVLRHHWPDVPLFNDVSKVGSDDLASVDCIVGGFPCQDVSLAGFRAGLAGKRSGLWWQFYRIIEEVRPRYVLIENVAGLLSSNGGRDLGAILGALGGLGYGYAYRVLDAQGFGVAQRRRRVFIVASLDDWEHPAEVLLEPAGLSGDPRESGASWPETARAAAQRVVESGGRDILRNHAGGQIVSGLTAGFGRAGVDLAHAEAGWLVPYDARSLKELDISTTLDASGARDGPRKSQGGMAIVHNDAFNVYPLSSLIEKNALDARALGDGPTETIPAQVGNRTDRGTMVVSAFRKKHRAISAEDEERWVDAETANTLTLTDYSPARTTNVVAHTLTARYGKGAPTLCDDGALPVTDARVRRLMPVECERLQGAPDGWTEFGVFKTKKGETLKPMSDTQRYQQMGNAAAVPNVFWIARRLAGVAQS